MLTAALAVLRRVPRWVWAAVLGALLVAAAWWWHVAAVERAVVVAVAAERAQLRAQAADELARAAGRALDQQTQAVMAFWERERESNQQLQRLGADVSAARGAAGRLRDTIAAMRGGAGPQGGGAVSIALHDAAPALADALGECSSRYTAVAELADRLAIQVADWQAYALDVLPAAGVPFIGPE